MTILEHDSHDLLFGGRRVFLACLGLWIAAFMALLPDIMGVKIEEKKTSMKMKKVLLRLQGLSFGLIVGQAVEMHFLVIKMRKVNV